MGEWIYSNMYSRRRTLKAIGTGVIGISTIGTASANGYVDYDDFYETIKKRYGKNEASIATSILKNAYQQKVTQGWEQQRVHDFITKKLDEHPRAGAGLPDIVEVSEKSGGSDRDASTNDDQPISSPPDDGDPTYVSLVYDDEDSSTAYNAEVNTDTSTLDNQARSYANTAGYGSAWAMTELWGTFDPWESGIHHINIWYYRQVFCADGEARINIFYQPEGSGKSVETVETITSTRDSSTSRMIEVNLDSGQSYNVGVQFECEANTAVDEEGRADGYYSGRELVVDTLSVEPQ